MQCLAFRRGIYLQKQTSDFGARISKCSLFDKRFRFTDPSDIENGGRLVKPRFEWAIFNKSSFDEELNISWCEWNEKLRMDYY